MEQTKARGISVGCGTERTGAFCGKLHRTAVIRNDITVFICHLNSDVDKVLAIGCKLAAVGRKHKMMSFPGGTDSFLFSLASVGIVSHDSHFSGLIDHIVPYKTIAFHARLVLNAILVPCLVAVVERHRQTLAVVKRFCLPLALNAIGFAVHNQFCRRI